MFQFNVGEDHRSPRKVMRLFRFAGHCKFDENYYVLPRSNLLITTIRRVPRILSNSIFLHLKTQIFFEQKKFENLRGNVQKAD